MANPNMCNSKIERTLVVFKPDAVQRGIVGEILTRFERVGLKIVGTKMLSPDREHYYTHYEEIGKMVTRRGSKAFNVTLDFMTQGPVIAMVFEGVEAVSLVRKLVGGTEPKSSAPGTIRGDYRILFMPVAMLMRLVRKLAIGLVLQNCMNINLPVSVFASNCNFYKDAAL